jgi:hypothetical protein
VDGQSRSTLRRRNCEAVEQTTDRLVCADQAEKIDQTLQAEKFLGGIEETAPLTCATFFGVTQFSFCVVTPRTQADLADSASMGTLRG